MTSTAALLVLALAFPAVAADELLSGKVVVVVAGTTFRFAGRPPAGTFLDIPDPTHDPAVEGGTLRVSDTGGTGGSVTFDLPPGPQWQRIPRNPSRPPKGYRYRGTGTADDPCRVVVVKARVAKALCKGSGVTLTPPFSGDVAIALTVDAIRYCALFGGTTAKTKPTVTKRRNAPPPAACPDTPAACQCGAVEPQGALFANGVGSGSCGTITGGTGGSIACGGLYFGGGLNAVPLPIVVPDFAQPTTFDVESCSGTTLSVGGTTEAEVGSRRCTTPGCLFGPPLPVPNAESVPTSTCLYNVVAQEADGTIACDTGDTNITLPLLTGVFLTGDILPNRCQGGTNPGGRCTVATQAVDCPGGTCQADPDLQPCPICNPTTRVCNGGLDNGMACTPGSTQSVTGQFPTSNDCRVSTIVKIGDLDVRLGLTTGTSSDTAVPSGSQQRVFCGFCRDPDTGTFQGPPAAPCGSNADCAAPFSACEQRNQGAFSNAAATQLSATGSAGGALSDLAPHPTTLVTVFCIPPVYNAVIDAQADLPGPGALTLPGTLQLVTALSPGGAFLDAEASAP